MSDEIKKYLETPEIPDKFKPENIHLILDGKRKRKNITRTFGSMVAAACILICAGTLFINNNKKECSLDTDNATNNISFSDSLIENSNDLYYSDSFEFQENFIKFKSYEELYYTVTQKIYTEDTCENEEKDLLDSDTKNSENDIKNLSVTKDRTIYKTDGSTLIASVLSDNDDSDNILIKTDLYELTGIDKNLKLKGRSLDFINNTLYIVLEIYNSDNTTTGIFTLGVSENEFIVKNSCFTDGKFYTEISDDNAVYIISEYTVHSDLNNTKPSDIQSYIPSIGSTPDDMGPIPVENIYGKINPDINNTGLRYTIISKVTEYSTEIISGVFHNNHEQDLTFTIEELITDVFG